MNHRHRHGGGSARTNWLLADIAYIQALPPADILCAMQEANIAPDLMYATAKTGMILTEDTMHLFSKERLAEWDAAIAEYESLHAAKAATKGATG